MAKPGAFQTWIEYIAARSIVGALRLLPVATSVRIGEKLGRTASFFAGNLRKTGERNLQLAFPDKTEDERRQILSDCFVSLGRQLGLFSHFATAPPDSLLRSVTCEGLEHLDSAKAQAKPVILFTGHVGAWELSSFALSLKNRPLSFLVRRIDNPRIEAFVDRSRTRFGNQSIDKRGAARAMLKILQSGDTLGLLVDLNTLDEEAIFVDFFGVPASTTFILAKLALRTDAVVLPVFVPWDPHARKYRFQILPPITFDRTGNETEDVRTFTSKFTGIVEQYVRQYPGQWLWIHKRWKTRPKGDPELY